MSPKPPIIVSTFDFERIEQLLDSSALRNEASVKALALELERAELVAPEEIPADVITMNSKARFIDDARRLAAHYWVCRLVRRLNGRCRVGRMFNCGFWRFCINQKRMVNSICEVCYVSDFSFGLVRMH